MDRPEPFPRREVASAQLICVDSSLAVKWVIAEDYSSEAITLYRATVRSSEPVVAPALIWFELTNICRQRVRRSVLSVRESIERLRDLERFEITVVTPAGLNVEALEISHRYDLPASYDAHYIALSIALGCDFWTADERLLRALDGRLPFVRWIADFRPGEPL